MYSTFNEVMDAIKDGRMVGYWNCTPNSEAYDWLGEVGGQVWWCHDHNRISTTKYGCADCNAARNGIFRVELEIDDQDFEVLEGLMSPVCKFCGGSDGKHGSMCLGVRLTGGDDEE